MKENCFINPQLMPVVKMFMILRLTKISVISEYILSSDIFCMTKNYTSLPNSLQIKTPKNQKII